MLGCLCMPVRYALRAAEEQEAKVSVFRSERAHEEDGKGGREGGREEIETVVYLYFYSPSFL